MAQADSGNTPGSSPSNPITVDQGVTPAPLTTAVAPTTLVKPWPGPTADAGSVSGIKAVTADKAGPNVLVATDSTGKLPASIIPGTAYQGPTHVTNPARSSGTVYTNAQTTPMWVSVKSSPGSNANISVGLYATVGVTAGASPTVVVSENVSSSAGGGAPVSSVFFVVPVGYKYKVDTVSVGIDTWTEWY